MEPTTIKIPVSPNVAKAYLCASEEEKRLIGQLVAAVLPRRRKPSLAELRAIAKRASAEAARNGLTPEILDEILNEG